MYSAWQCVKNIKTSRLIEHTSTDDSTRLFCASQRAALFWAVGFVIAHAELSMMEACGRRSVSLSELLTLISLGCFRCVQGVYSPSNAITAASTVWPSGELRSRLRSSRWAMVMVTRSRSSWSWASCLVTAAWKWAGMWEWAARLVWAAVLGQARGRSSRRPE